MPEKTRSDEWNIDMMHSEFVRLFGMDITDISDWKTSEEITDQKAFDILLRLAKRRYEQQRQRYGELMHSAERQIALHVLDASWKKHLQNMDHLQMGIGLRGYAQKNPLNEYKKEAFQLFEEMMTNFKRMLISYICKLELSDDEINEMRRSHEERDANLNAVQARNGTCGCGSGLKFKHCCGKLK
jgi:preprotein translocase subunit SecA